MSYNCPFLDSNNGNARNENLKSSFEKEFQKLSLDYENLKKENEQLKMELKRKKNSGMIYIILLIFNYLIIIRFKITYYFDYDIKTEKKI